MKYTMNIKINPQHQYITVEGAANGVNSDYLEKIYLNENFEIDYLKNENENIPYIFNKNGERPPFDNASRPIEINQPINNLESVT